jgi:hypothetical protein
MFFYPLEEVPRRGREPRGVPSYGGLRGHPERGCSNHTRTALPYFAGPISSGAG